MSQPEYWDEGRFEGALDPAMTAASPDPAAPEIAPGVHELDHTADVGIKVWAKEPEELFRRAALGMARLMRGDVASRTKTGVTTRRTVELASDSLDLLLVRWLGELLYLDEVEGFVFNDAIFTELGEGELRATVTGRMVPDAPERQLKGVTYHGLRLEAEDGGWQAQVIFDI